MIIKNTRKITSMAVALAIAVSCTPAFADDEAIADAVDASESAADISAEDTANGRDAPEMNFADILESSSVFESLDTGTDTKVDIELPKTKNNSNKPPDATEKPETTQEPIETPEVVLNATSGSCGNDISWSYNTTTKVLTLTGTGYTKSYTQSIGPPWKQYKTSIEKVEISSGITSLGECLFYECSAISEIEIPNTVTSISGMCFYGCSSLESVELPSGLTRIGNYAFYKSGLVSIEIPDSVTSLNGYLPDSNIAATFANCYSLEYIKLSAGLNAIPRRCFEQCSSLKKVEIPDGVTTIYAEAFYNCSNTTIYVPNSVTTIYDSANYSSAAFVNIVADIVIDNYTDAISGAPWGSEGNIIWLRSLTEDPDEEDEPELAKYNLRVNNRGELTHIEDWTGGTDNGDGTWTSVTNRTFINCASIPTIGDLADGTEVTVTSIGAECFKDCFTLDSTVSISNNITAIGTNAFSGSSAGTIMVDNYEGSISGEPWGSSGTISYMRDFYVSSVEQQLYTGSAITPSVTVTLKGTNGTVYATLTKGTDYTLSYQNNTNTGTANINVSYRGSYAGYSGTSNNVSFDIVRLDITNEVTVSDLGEYPYTGSAIEPEPYVRLGTTTLVKDVDYELSYSNNTNATYDALCAITFIGCYSGSVTKRFRITESAYTITYSGAPIRYDFGNVPFVDVYEITLHCADGTEFVGNDIGNIGILEEEGAGYNAGDTIAIWCSDWNPELANHGVYIGGAPIILTLNIEKLVFTQEDAVDMTIETYEGAYLEWSPAPDWVRFQDRQCTGQEIEFLFDSILWCGEYGLSGGYDFVYSHRDNITPGTGYVVIDFNQSNTNIGGVIEIPFSIVATDISGMVISGYNPSYTYTGSYIRPAIRVTNNGAVLTKDTDYTLSITNNLNVGTANITVTGINAYSGTAMAQFSVVPRSGDEVSISPIGDVIYSGMAYRPGLEIIDENR